jgi:small-conductance mechanosensitive channel
VTNVVFDVLWLGLAGGALYVLLRVLGWALAVLPVSQKTLELAERAWPVVASLGIVAYVLFAVSVLLDRAPGLGSLTGAVVLGVLVALSWGVLRDAVAGVYLRAGRACSVGDFVRIDDVEGRVERLGWRAIVVITPSDNEAIVPYSRAVRTAILRTKERAATYPHAFQVPVPKDRRVSSAKEEIRRAALLSHWSSVVREPLVELGDEQTLAVTVFALDPERAYEIEAAVRRALDGRSAVRESGAVVASRSTLFKT